VDRVVRLVIDGVFNAIGDDLDALDTCGVTSEGLASGPAPNLSVEAVKLGRHSLVASALVAVKDPVGVDDCHQQYPIHADIPAAWDIQIF